MISSNKNKGFTIVELIIVIAVTAILAGVLIPVFVNVITKSNDSTNTQNCKNINTYLDTELETNNISNVLELKELLDNSEYKDSYISKSDDQHFYWCKTDNNVYLINDIDSNFQVIYPTENNINNTINKNDCFRLDYNYYHAYCNEGLKVSTDIVSNVGDTSLNITGNELPDKIGVSGAKLLEYNQTTGLVVISNVNSDVRIGKQNYLKFTALENNSSVTPRFVSGIYEYSLDDGKTWQNGLVDFTNKNYTTINLNNIGDSVLLKGNNCISCDNSLEIEKPYINFLMTGSISSSGSVTSITDGIGSNPKIELTPYCYFEMFDECESLKKAPELIAEKLSDSCYSCMFCKCTSLEETPNLPSTTLGPACYANMFSGCTSLTKVSTLPAKTLSNMCYFGMFEGCSSLKEAPELPAKTLTKSCYLNMFLNCTSLEECPILPAVELEIACYGGMFSGCTKITKAPSLPATELKATCYSSMFAGCTSLTEAPVLPAISLQTSCYSSMFSGCISLTTCPNLPSINIEMYCYEKMFNGCTNITECPVLPATVLKKGCYKGMFSGCTKITETPTLPATTLEESCYEDMFKDCTSLIKITKLNAVILPKKCYAQMFMGCTSLKITTTGTNETLIFTCPDDQANIGKQAILNMFEGVSGFEQYYGVQKDTSYYWYLK